MWGGRDASCNRSSSAGNADDADHHHLELPYLPPRYIHVVNDGCDYIHHGTTVNISSPNNAETVNKSSSSPSSSSFSPSSMQLQLTQFRVAWFEQLILRMNYIPHVVNNSGYAATESTGALPSLLDLSTSIEGSSKKRSTSNNNQPAAALIGRHQPGGMGSSFFHQCHERSSSTSNKTKLSTFIHSGSHIVDYLRRKYATIMGDNILFPEQLETVEPHTAEEKESHQLHVDAMAYESMIQDKLNYILFALRYANDPAWEGVYKHQYIRATLDPNGEMRAKAAAAGGGGSASSGAVISKTRAFFSFWARYQAYSERLLALHNLLPSTHSVTSLSTHSGLAMELFRYNDYRCTSSSNVPDATAETDKEPIQENTTHQHHPYSSFIVSYGGGGGGDSGRVNVYRAMELADSYYAALEGRLLASSSQSGCNDDDDPNAVGESERMTYLLGMQKPTYVDALLFAHLAEALCDIHLVLVLAKHSRLTRYFQRMYDHYFGDEYVTAWERYSSRQDSTESADWIQKNNFANALNAFNQIPEPTATTSKSNQTVDENGCHGSNNMVHAVQIMQQIAVHCHELDEALRDAAALRNAEGKEISVLESCHRPVGARLYQWLMGDDVNFWGSGGGAKFPSTGPVCGKVEEESDDDDEGEQQSDNKNEPSTNEEEERRYQLLNRMKRDRRSHDELWLSGVIMTVVVAFVISAAGKSKR